MELEGDERKYELDGDERKYVLEKIVGKREKRGDIQYYLKWCDLEIDENTWEFERNLRRDDKQNMIGAYEKALRMGKTWSVTWPKTHIKKVTFLKEVPKVEIMIQIAKIEEKGGKGMTGFDLGWIPERIVAAMTLNGDWKFMMKWENTCKLSWISSRDAREKCPQLIINFYEMHLV